MHSISGKSKRKISCLFAKIWIQMINLLSLGGISRMVEHSIAVSPICMPCKVFCVISISKQMLKPWNDGNISTLYNSSYSHHTTDAPVCHQVFAASCSNNLFMQGQKNFLFSSGRLLSEANCSKTQGLCDFHSSNFNPSK